MNFYKGNMVPGRTIVRKLQRDNARETAARQQVAERVAKEQLAIKARKKGADAIIGYSISGRRINAGYEVIVSGVPVVTE